MSTAIYARRLLSLIDTSGECWEWTGTRTANGGYGLMGYWGRQTRVHRIVYELVYGPIPAGFDVDHQCNNPPCVRPSHLKAMTHRENSLRSASAPPAINARKTHCPQGHPYDGDNLYVTQQGARHCRRCTYERNREIERRRREAAGPREPRPAVTHCYRGHAYDEENSYIDPSGGRRCRACARSRRERMRGEAT